MWRPPTPRLLTLCALATVMSGCFDTTLPPVPGPPKPGSISGRVVTSLPGRPGVVAVKNASIEVLGTGLSTKSDSNGFFLITGITSDAGQVLFRVDLNEDGKPELQKLLSLQALKAGADKQIALGDVVLSENATVRGLVLRDDVLTPSGHGGTTVFVPVGPYTTTTADDGSFVLAELPEGTISLAFFRAGYSPKGIDNVTISSGQELTLRTVKLLPETVVSPPAELKGRVVTAEGTIAVGASIVIENTSMPSANRTATTGADGTFDFADVTVGIYSVTASKAGSSNARLLNLLLTGGVTTLPDLVLGPGVVTGQGGGVGGGSGGGSGGGGGTGGGSGGGTGGGSGGGTGGGGGTQSDGGNTGGDAGTMPGQDAGAGTADGGKADAGPGGTAPAAPANVSATAANTAVTLSWSASAGATGYRIYWAAGTTVSKSSGAALPNVSSPYFHQGLTNATTYAYVVTAINAFGESAESAVATATPSASASTQPPAIAATRPEPDQTGVAPSAPIVIRATKLLDGKTATNSTITLVGDAGVVTTTVKAAGDTVTVTPSAALTAGAPYLVTISTGLKDASGLALTSGKSWEFTTGSAAPANLSAIVGNYVTTLQWDPVPGATQYAIARATTAGGPASVLSTSTGPSYTDSNAPTGTPYFYTVTAQTQLGVTAPSNEVQVITSPSKPPIPSTLTAWPGQTEVLLTWYQVGAATGYTLLRATSPAGPFTPVVTGYTNTSYLDTGRTADASVFYVVQTEVTNASGTTRSPFSVEASATPRSTSAPAPATFTATPGYAWARMSWAAVTGASGYVVYRADAPTSLPAQVAWVTSGTTLDQTLTNGTNYRYWVGAVTGDVIGDLAETNVTPLATLAPQPSVVNQPSPQVGAVTVNWSNYGGATSNILLRSTDRGGPYTQINTTYNDNTAVPGTIYYYVVRADNGSVQGQYSNEVTMAANSSATPAVPTSLAAQSSNAAVQVSWAPVANAAFYDVYLSTSSGGPYTTFGCRGAEPLETRCTLSATNETPIFIVVRANNGTTASAFSAEVPAMATALGPTAGIPRPSVSVTGGNSVLNVSWPVVVKATDYRVYRKTYTTDWSMLGSTTGNAWTDTGLTNGVAYKYAVQAINSVGPQLSPWDVTSYVTPSAQRPLRPQIIALTPYLDGVMVSWLPIAGATQYVVQAGFDPGKSIAAPVTNCYTSEPYETRCFMPLVNGTSYVLSMYARSPEGQSAFTDEMPVTANPSVPADTQPTVHTGNGELTVTAPLVSGAATYKLFRRSRTSDWAQVGSSAKPYFFEKLVNRVQYQYAMQAISSASVPGRWSMTGWFAAYAEAPSTPGGLKVSPGNGELLVSWLPVAGVTQYQVYSAPDVGGPFTYRGYTLEANETRLTLSATNGTPVAVTVIGISNGQNSDYAEPVVGTASSALPATPAPQLVPGNNAMYLVWSPISGATGYRVYRRSSTSDWARLIDLGSPRLTDYAVINGEQFRYAVEALNGAGASAWSPTPMRLVDDRLPTAPNDVTVQNGNASSQVFWSRVPGATSYTVYTAPSASGPYSGGCTSYGEYDTTCRISVTNGTGSWAVVVAANAVGVGVPSPELPVVGDASFPAATTAYAAAGTGAGTAHVTWYAVSGATSYRVYRRLDTSTFGKVADLGASATMWDDSGLTTGTVYTYSIEPVNAAGPGAWSSPAAVTAP